MATRTPHGSSISITEPEHGHGKCTSGSLFHQQQAVTAELAQAVREGRILPGAAARRILDVLGLTSR